MDTHYRDGVKRVQIVDDDDGFRNGLTRVLNASGLKTASYRCVGEYLIAEPECSPGCLLLDIYMPGPSGLDLWDALDARDLSPPAIFISGCNDVPISVRAMKAGAIDFITKPVEVPRLLASIHYALAIDTARRAQHNHVRRVTERYETLYGVERAIFLGIVQGKLNKQLAGELQICERTVKTYRARVMSKLHVSTLPDLVRVSRLLDRSGAKRTSNRQLPTW